MNSIPNEPISPIRQKVGQSTLHSGSSISYLKKQDYQMNKVSLQIVLTSNGTAVQ